MNFLQQSLVTLFNNPKEFSTQIMRERSVTLGFLGYGGGAFAMAFFANIRGGASVGSFLLQMFLYLVFTMFFSFMLAAVTQIFLDLFSEKGNAIGLFSMIGISELAKLLLVCFSLMGLAINGGAAFNSLTFLVITVFQFFFLLGMLGHAYNLSKTMVFMALIFTMALAGFMFFMLFIITPVALVLLAIA